MFYLLLIYLGKIELYTRDEIIKNIEIKKNPPVVFFKMSKEKKLVIDYRKKSIQKITIIPTGKCNLDCSYCITKRYRKYVKEKISYKDVCDFIKNYYRKDQKIFVSFTGGGEPTQRMDFIKNVVENLRKQFRFIKFGITTNGVLNQKNLNWLIKNMDAINVSCDGPPEIQDRQRPLKGGGKSSKVVERTIKELVSKRINFKI